MLLNFYEQVHEQKLNREFEKEGEVEYITLSVSSFIESFFREGWISVLKMRQLALKLHRRGLSPAGN